MGAAALVEPGPWQPRPAEEAARFLALAKEDRFFALYLLAATTGMRRAELCGLRWPAVHLDRRALSVTTTRVVVRGHVQDSDDTKSPRGRRLLALDPATVGALTEQREGQDEERIAFGTGYGETDLVEPPRRVRGLQSLKRMELWVRRL